MLVWVVLGTSNWLISSERIVPVVSDTIELGGRSWVINNVDITVGATLEVVLADSIDGEVSAEQTSSPIRRQSWVCCFCCKNK